ncbi:short-chain dehydrogenase [Shewanella mangrovi]|uniref:Short-chain dehydrogenase n=1 Tax=Shewanella mangrovi TaxID=1515746 RepID=A0A094LMV8_9GAMM|nr:SDR family oxidoreductase [Shewanella mangrovi]KFZ36453.1 short-chain dehydrogenase [Shewanella mangrovi]
MLNKTWLITGASSGLGLMLTKKALLRGDKVFASVRRKSPLDELKATYPNQLEVLNLDVTEVNAVRSAVDKAFLKGSIDYVVSNAAYGLFGVAEALSDQQIERQLATNLIGSIQFIRAALPHLRKQNKGRIVQVSSEGGQVAYPNFSLYHASKWGIEGFIESLSLEVKEFGIDCLIIEPGPTETPFIKGLDLAKSLACYKGSAAEQMRTSLFNGEFPFKGDTENTVNAMLKVIDMSPPPFRVALGSIAFDNIQRALRLRLVELEKQKVLAYSADKN